MSRNRGRFYAVLAILLVILSVIAFAAPFIRNSVFWLSYGFAVIAIGVQAYSWPKAFSGEGARSRVYGFPLARVTTIYLVLQLLVSLVCMILSARLPLWPVLIVDVLLLGFAAIGFITTDAVRDEVERQETVKRKSTVAMVDLRVKAEGIARACREPEKQKQLESLAEEFRFSDPVSSEETEELERKLSFLLDELKETGDTAMIGRIESVLDERNRLCKAGK